MNERRTVLKAAVLAGGLLAFVDAAGAKRRLTPAAARAQAMPFRVLSPREAATLASFADTLVPGAAAAGIAHFVDAHLAVPPADSLLMLRYLDVPPPWKAFYQGGAAALDAMAQTCHQQHFTALDDRQRFELAAALAAASPAQWPGLPSTLLAFAVRADAVDVVYGTVAGFEKLDVPYLEHILPESRW